MDLCPICESKFSDGACPSCPKDLAEAHSKMLREGGFKLASWPENGTAAPDKLKTLRTAILKDSWMIAEYEWLKLARGTLGSTEEARKARARCFEKLACLLDGLARQPEAQHMRERAASLLKPVGAPVPKSQQRNASYSFMDQIRAEEAASAPHITDDAKKRLDQAIAKAEQRTQNLKIIGFAAAGLIMGAFINMNFSIVGGLLGLGGGWAFAKR